MAFLFFGFLTILAIALNAYVLWLEDNTWYIQKN